MAASAEEWEHVCSDVFQLCGIDWVASGFHGRLESASLGAGTSVIQVRSGPMGVTRNERHASRVPRDDWMFVWHRGTGAATVSHRDRTSLIQPGEAVLIETAQPYRFSFAESLDQVVLKTPRELLPRTPGLDELCGRPIPADLPALRILAATARELAAVADRIVDPEARSDLAYTVSDLMRVTLRCAEGLHPQAAAGPQALLALMKQFVRDHLADPDLGPVSLAAAHHVSVRYVTVLFRDDGTSPAAYIRDERLARARRCLTDPRLRDASIAAIAGLCGFEDATTFTRAFRRRYGLRPSDLRTQGGALAGTGAA